MASRVSQQKAIDNALERKLKALEKKYDTGTAHYRRYAQELDDIEELRKAGKIDHAHADLYKAKAKEAFDSVEEKKKAVKEADAFQKRGWFGRTFTW